MEKQLAELVAELDIDVTEIAIEGADKEFPTGYGSCGVSGSPAGAC
ncbi:hypothetical protein ACF9IK_09480 [Kitasatospora hibisci]